MCARQAGPNAGAAPLPENYATICRGAEATTLRVGHPPTPYLQSSDAAGVQTAYRKGGRAPRGKPAKAVGADVGVYGVDAKGRRHLMA